MPEIPNTEFENKLNESNFGKMAPSPSFLPGPSKPISQMSLDELSASLKSQGDLILNRASNPILPELISPKLIDQTGRYNKQLIGWDNEDLYGSMQSNWDKAANGLLKTISLAGTTFLQGTAGLVVGLGNVVAGNGANSFYNNDFSNMLDKWNKDAENALPNYYTAKETNADWYSTDNLFTANFLWDKLIKNVGFSIGAIYSGGVVSKGISATMKGIGLLTEAAQGAKVVAALEEALPATTQASRLTKFQEVLSNLAPKVSAGQVDRTLTSLFGAATEGGIEALQGLNEFRDQKIKEFQKTNFRMPNDEEMRKINDNAADVGNVRLALNIGLLSVTNYIQLPKILGSKYSTSKAIANTEAAAAGEIGGIRKTATGAFERALPTTRLGKFASSAYNAGALTFSASEAFEEGAQYAIERGVNDYYSKKYGGAGADFLSSLNQGVYDTFHNKEGLESILLGGLSGGLQQIRGKVKKQGFTGTGGTKGAATEKFVSDLNQGASMTWLKDMQDAASRGANIMQEQEAYIRQGDILNSKDAEADLMHNYLSVRLKHGRYDLVKDDVSSLRLQSATQQGLDKLKEQGIANTEDTIISFTNRLNNFEKHADNLKVSLEALNLRYGGIYNENKERVYSEDVIDKMAYAVSKVGDYDTRIPEVSASLIEKGIPVQGAIDSFSDNKFDTKEAVAAIESLNTTIDEKDTLKQSLNDVLEMTARRQHFLGQYNEMAVSPTKFKEASETPDTIPDTVRIKTKDGEEDIEVGTEYYLGKVTEYSKEGNEVNRFPTLTILGENEDGTIKIKDANGQVKDVNKSVLEDYKLGKVSDLQNNKKAKFYFDHINDIFEFNFGKGKKQKGRLQFSPKDKILLFTYKDQYGKIKSIEVTGDQFVPKEGFSNPMISKVGTLTAAQQKSLEDYAAEADERKQAKRSSRLAILESLVDETGKRISSVQEMLQKKYSEFETISNDLLKLENKIKTGELTKRNNFKSTTNRAIKAANKLSRLQEDLKLEIQNLEAERNELEFNLEYFVDLASNIDELPTDSQDFFDELKQQTADIENLILGTGDSINKISSLLDNVQKALDTAMSLAREAISTFEKKFPKAPLSLDNQEFVDFLKANPNFLKNKPTYKEDLKQLEEFIAQVEDLDIVPNERTLSELKTQMEGIISELQELEKQYKAKEAIVNKYSEMAQKAKEARKAEEALQKDKETQAKFFNVQRDLQKFSGVAMASQDEESDSTKVKLKVPPRKAASILFTSTAPTEVLTRDSDIRHDVFLNTLDFFPNRGDIKFTYVTKNNEKALKLEGITDTFLGDYKVKEGEEPILRLYLEVSPEGTFFINKEGKRVAKMGDEVDQNEIIFAGMVSTSLEDSHGIRYSGTEEEVLPYQEQWKNRRDVLLSYTDSYETPENFYVSRGKAVKTKEKQFILGNLVTEQQLKDNEPVLVVSTLGTIEHQGRAVNIPVGSVMIQNGSTLEYANNRNLTAKEVDNVYNVLKEFVKQANETKTFPAKLTTFLRGIMYFSSPYTKDDKGNYLRQQTPEGTDKPTARNQFYFHQGNLYMGEREEAVPFTTQSIEANEQLIKAFLSGAYNHVNNKYLTDPILSSQPFIEYTGNLEEKEWANYQTYLLSKEGRSTEEVPLSTQIRPIDSAIPNDRNFLSKYSYSEPVLIEKEPVVDTPQETEGETEWDRTMRAWAEEAANTEEPVVKGGFNASNFTGGEETEEKPGNNKIIALSDLMAPKPVKTNLTAEEIFKKQQEEFLKNNPGFSPEESQFRVALPAYNYALADFEKERKYLEENFPFAIKTLENLIAAGNGVFAFGAYKDAIIYLSKQMEEGTGYHEAFEGVFDVFLNNTEKKRIFREFLERKGSFIDRPTGQEILYKDATLFQAKEQMAEEFRDFKLTGELPSSIEVADEHTGLIKLFKELLDWLKAVLTGEIHSLDHVFERMDSAYYKNVAFKNAPTQYLQAREKIGEFDAQQTDSVVRGVVSSVFQNLMEAGETKLINDLDFGEKVPQAIYDKIKQQLEYYYRTQGDKSAYAEMKAEGLSDKDIFNILVPIGNSLFGNWDQIVKYSGELLKTFKILQENEEDKEGEDSEVTREESYLFRSEFEFDGKKNAPASIKLLIATIQESVFAATTTIKPGEEGLKKVLPVRDASTRMQKMVDYASTFNRLLDDLNTINTLEGKEKKLEELSNQYPEYVRLINRLKTKSPNIQDWFLRIKFYNTFSKQHPEALNTYMLADGTSSTGSADLDNTLRQLSNNWLNVLKATAIFKDNKYIFDATKIPNTIDPLKYFASLGVKFSPEQVGNMSKGDMASLRTIMQKFKHVFSGKALDITSIHKLGLKNALEDLYKVVLKSQNLSTESVFQGLDGNFKQAFVQTNAVSRIVNDLNNAKTLDELFEESPYLNDTYSQDSWYFQNALYGAGKKLGFNLAIKYIQGIVNVDGQNNMPTEKLSKTKKLLQAINQNLNENYYLLIPADSKTEWMVGMKNPFLSLSEGALDQFYKYYQGENAQGLEGRIFETFGKNLSKEQFSKKFRELVNKEVEEQFKELKDHNILENISGGKFKWNGIDGKYVENNNLKADKLTAKQVQDILEYRTVNFMFNNIEMHKLFFGDPKFYSDFKRFKSFLSPREQALYNSKKFDSAANHEYNTDLKVGDPGYQNYKEYLKTVTQEDVISMNSLPGYTAVKGTDAQAFTHPAAYKQMRIKTARWNSLNEEQIQYIHAEDRQLMSQDKLYTYTNEALKKADEKLLAKGDLKVSRFSPLKPIVSGFDAQGPILDKYSITMLSYRMVRGTNMAAQYKRMLDNEIDYTIYKSGRKVGGRGEDSIYNADGSPNTSKYLDNTIINVPFKWFGIQVETQGDKFSQTWGSQLGKLSTVNLMDGGVPIDTKMSFEEWNSLSEGEKVKQSSIYDLVSQERGIREAMILDGYKRLLSAVGINEDGTVSKKKLLALITDELSRRELNDNIKDALQLKEDGDFLIPLEALNNYEQIKNVIFSYLDKYISRPKVGGGSKIQTSGVGMEVAGNRIVAHTKNGKTTYTSTGLHFYTKEQPWCGIMIGNWFQKELRKISTLKEATDQEILDFVNNSPDGKEILSGIGFRIPTQELNSVENFRIEAFLPDYLGDMVVVPEALTTKSGGDFDVDKLNTYLKNVYVNAKGELKLVPFQGLGQLQAFRDLIAKEQLEGLFVLSAKDKIEAYTKSEEEILDVISNKQALEDAENAEDLAQRMYKQSLENEYYRVLDKLLSLPQNFDRLTTPNTSKNLEDMRDNLVKVAPSEFSLGSFKSTLSPTFMNNLRHMYAEGKGGVGIAASGQVQNAISQKTPVVILPSKKATLKDRNERDNLGNGIVMLPSNKLGGFTTISAMKDRAGRYISDKISQFINGFVDIANDPFLVQLGVTRNNAGMFLLLERVGVPTPVTVLFMNQPIIREYQKQLERKGMGYPYINDEIKEIRRQFPVSKSPLPTSFQEKGLEKHLEDHISDFYNGKLTTEQNEFQQFVLSEYLKYAVMAQNLFRFSQATNYDTTKFTNPYIYLRKLVRTRDAKENNIFSNTQEVMDRTFVGTIAKTIGEATTKISNAFFKFLSSDIQPYVFPTMYKLAERKKMNDVEFTKVARKVEQSFIAYLIQNTTGLNKQLSTLLINEATSAAKELNQMKNTIEAMRNNPFPIISKFITQSVESPNATKSIRMLRTGTDVFTQNTLIAAMQEIKANPKTKSLYGKLVRTAFLQSGIAKTPISFMDVVPVEDFKELVYPAIEGLYNKELLRGFQATDTFFRNSWADKTVVPALKADWVPKDSNAEYEELIGFGDEDFTGGQMIIKQELDNAQLKALAKLKGSPNFRAFKVSEMSPQFSSDFGSVQVGEKGNKKTILLKKLYYPNSTEVPTWPYPTKTGKIIDPNNKYAVYYQINPLGDGYQAQEHYDTLRPSVFKETKALSIPVELTAREILSALQGNILQSQKQQAPTEEDFNKFKDTLKRKDC